MTTSTKTENTLERRQAVARLIEDRQDLLIVAGLGSAVWDVEAVGEHDLNFYILGAMGSVLPIALGLAIAQPDKPVLALTGDAELLMSSGAIATAAIRKPRNLSVAVLDNGRYGETGSQRSHTGLGVDLSGIALASGFPVVRTMSSEAEIDGARQIIHDGNGPVFITLKVKTDMPPVVMPVRDGAHLKHRFRQRLLGPDSTKI